MSDGSKIGWLTDENGKQGASWPVTVGCDHVSAGCDLCFAARLTSGRLRHLPEYAGLAEHGRFTGEVRCLPERLGWPERWRRPRRIFVCSMSDLFHHGVPADFIVQVFAVMANCPQHTFLVFTKRHARMRALLSDPSFKAAVLAAAAGRDSHRMTPAWPLFNVVLCVSAEDQRWAEIRVHALLATPAAVRGVSVEPMLGPVDLRNLKMGNGALIDALCGDVKSPDGTIYAACPGALDWVVAGGESGPGARVMHTDWVRALRDQCQETRTRFFFKQWGEWGPAPWRADREPGETDGDYKARAEAVCATHAFPVWAYRYGMGPVEASHKPWGLERVSLPEGQAPVRRHGVSRAGKTLDGREWTEFPRIYRPAAAA